MNNEIKGFFSWKIPSGEGVLYIEGIPTDEERNENLRRTSERRKFWQPDITALQTYKQLTSLEGDDITIQIWEDLMEMCPDDGPSPFSCKLVKVFTKEIQEEDRKFLQLFIEFKNPKVIRTYNDRDNPIYQSQFDSRTGTYIYNCSSFYWIKKQ